MPDEIAAGSTGVALEQLGVGREAVAAGRIVGASSAGSRVGPVHAEVSDVGERVPEGAELPVEHGVDAPGDGVGQAVPEAKVAVGDDRVALGGDASGEPVGDLVDRRELPGLGVGPLSPPAAQLALDVAIALGEIAQPDLVDVHVVQVGERVDEDFARPPPRRRLQWLRLRRAVEHHAVDEAHHVERHAVDGLVGAQRERGRDGNGSRPEGGDDAELAPDVVGGRQHVAERRAAHDEPAAVGGGDGVGQVRAAAADERRVERADRTVDVDFEPPADGDEIEAVQSALAGGHRRQR